MRGDEAKEVCPEIQLVQVPVARDKADLNTYREAGTEVVRLFLLGPHLRCLVDSCVSLSMKMSILSYFCIAGSFNSFKERSL